MAEPTLRADVSALALAGVVFSAFLFALPSVADDRPGALAILATTQSLGNLEPCNCVEGMLGGYPRRLSVIARERAGGGDVLVVDGGDVTGKQAHPALLTHKTRAAFDLLRAAGAQAVAVGERDLRLGHQKLSRLARDAKLNLLAANVWIVDGETRTRPFASHVTVTLGGRRVTLIGALDADLGDPSGELELSDAAEAIAALELPDGLRIVLFHGSAEAAREQLVEVKGIDVIVCGHDQTRTQPLTKLGETLLVELLRDARSVTRLELPAGEAAASLTHVALDGFIPDDARARGRVDHYYREVAGLPEPPRKPTEGGEFMGSQTCMACHKEQHDVFLTTAHSGAYGKILAKDPKRGTLPECIGCHVTGYGYQGGFVSREESPALAEVGCESCHGVGGNHVARGGGRGYGLLEGFPESWESVCMRCHDPSNSPKFEFKSWLRAIKHWKDRDPSGE